MYVKLLKRENDIMLCAIGIQNSQCVTSVLYECIKRVLMSQLTCPVVVDRLSYR